MAKNNKILREMNAKELTKQIQDWHVSLFQLRCNLSTGQLTDNSQIKKRRRQIAVAKTLAKALHSIKI